MRIVNFIFIALAMAISAGCTGYSSEFSCPNTYNGRCVSIQGAYEIALAGKDSPEYDPAYKQKQKDGGKNGKNATELEEQQSDPEEVAHASYKESLYKKFDVLLKEPNTPVVAPPQVLRVLLLPYKGDSNELFMLRYVYFFVDEPKWVLGDSLVGIEED
jgi:conjugal transfer pilus assembly protein TraV